MNAYEVTYIINPDLSEDETKNTCEKYSALISDNGGKLSKVDVWGRRKLAYEINGHIEGTYVCMNFESSIENMNECKRLMGLDEAIVRSLFINLKK